ncbi:GGDEF domain-containing protein [Endomicrobium proavitum]|uniref:diguanylate cyclase n=1 Tax=Endomicrobium proavitum TaxID=1408281 RepID=A0A0G3WI21_9BACT|nr:sensor domain-containing diguanylate cyclase [Endomicrobium proavitum]AKL97530.1 putative Diguanylate cyclase [Endomicrobium proavitum]
MIQQKKNDIFLDLISTVILPVAAGIFFIEWAFDALNGSDVIFPLIGLLVLLLYYFSGSFYSGIIMLVSVIFAGFTAFVIEDSPRTYIVLLECGALAFFYVVLESYNDYYSSVRNSMEEEYDVLDMESTIKDSEIAENKRVSSVISDKMDNFKKIGHMMQSFESSLDEEDIVYKSGALASQFMGSGEWNLVKNSKGDEFAKYVKTTGFPLVSGDLSQDKRFSGNFTTQMSVIAVPVEIDGNFWGIIRGTSSATDAFGDADLRLLSILSGVVSNVINNANLYKRVQGLAVTDVLTGLFTQTYFKERVRDEVKRAHTGKFSLSVAILDVDYFKKVNDTYGHQAGDAVLRQIGAILKKRFRETDLIARYGGEEFAVLMLHTGCKEARVVLERIRTTIENEQFTVSLGEAVLQTTTITVSIGVACACEETVIQKADAALYEAKNSGRNKTVEYRDD